MEINESEFCSSLVVLEHGALEESCLAFLIACFDVNFGHGYESGSICKMSSTDNVMVPDAQSLTFLILAILF